jgi:hypothetical protein
MNGGAAASRDLEDQQDCGDFPVHNKRCLWMVVEKWVLNFNCGANAISLGQ